MRGDIFMHIRRVSQCKLFSTLEMGVLNFIKLSHIGNLFFKQEPYHIVKERGKEMVPMERMKQKIFR